MRIRIKAKTKRKVSPELWILIDKDGSCSEGYASNIKDIMLFAKWLLSMRVHEDYRTGEQAVKECRQIIEQYREDPLTDFIETDSFIIMTAENWKDRMTVS